MPALLNIMSSLPCLAMVVSTTFLTSESTLTSQWIKENASSFPMFSHREWPSWSWTSAMTTFAPCRRNNFAVVSPIPLAPPVITATLPSNLQNEKLLFVVDWFYLNRRLAQRNRHILLSWIITFWQWELARKRLSSFWSVYTSYNCNERLKLLLLKDL